MADSVLQILVLVLIFSLLLIKQAYISMTADCLLANIFFYYLLCLQ